MEDRASQRLTVAVIGGGWAGSAAALALADKGFSVALYEMAPALGGRARRVVRDGLPLDNGQHVLLGAYVEARRAIADVHGTDAALPVVQRPLALVPFAATQPGAITVRAWRLPSPYSLVAGMMAAHGFSWRDRFATLRWFARLRQHNYRIDANLTVAQMTASAPPRVRDRLLNPLCVSALNTPASRASARIFANVLRAAFDGHDGASDMVLPATDLASLFPDAAARVLASKGHAVHLRSEATILEAGNGSVRVRVGDEDIRASAAIVAVAPHQFARVFAADSAADAAIREAIARIARLEWEPIVTIYLGYAGRIDIPEPLVQLDDSPGQWVFDRRDILAHAEKEAPAMASLLAVVISARGEHDSLSNDALTATVDAQLRRLRPSMPTLVWSQVIAERRATYSCTPSAVRPSAGRLVPGIYLAGDYTDQEFPATLETAVRSGRIAALALARDFAR